ncbi:MAG: 2-hydroxyacid dehydrogenase [Clostridia bacterium]|nr:2-hydroxyacid dehydrogenase [Clostridia bacterium]MCI1999524.1 2-hydroxyacid dehydrogenase [Clostridia bacterium]MCI2014097.1 2-hydroxyacid dehydrogenase [Clostridia bacterium]
MDMKIAFYDTKEYDRIYFDKIAPQYGFDIIYYESRLNASTAVLADGCDAICIFVSDNADKETIDKLSEYGIKVILLRCAGYDNVDLKACEEKNITVLRVPSYSPTAVAEYASALMLTLNRRIHKAYMRTREFNFKINGLMGVTLRGRTAGIIGTGKIGKIMVEILKGYGMEVLANDLYPDENLDVEYTSLDDLFNRSDVITIHCPLTKDTKYLINKNSISKMKDGVILINTSRGALVDTDALIDGLVANKFRGVALDVYEEEDKYFFEDKSQEIIKDTDLIKLMAYPNVIVTSHQAFFTDESMEAIAQVTCDNLKEFEQGLEMKNKVSEEYTKK